MQFELEQGTAAILLPLKKSEPCTTPDCPTLSRYAISIDGSPYEIRCRKHLPENIIQEYWTMRMLLVARDGDEEKARGMLRLITAEARLNGYERCAMIADVKAEGAVRLAHSNKDMAKGAEDMAKQIARSIRLAE